MVTYARFLLYPGEVLRVDGGRPVNIACEQGELWLTAGRERIDHVLRPGERVRCPKGLILIEGSGVLSISPPTASSFGWWRGWLPFRNLALIGQSNSGVLS
ncbi:DUF2917 domain-containing protein [Azonexus sp. IMCC34842]|uniref:DUF2917 domain-containing protein n=1 Tax=Azonexus sp. IMCC34842 TaxID=3420950 RepID=UPI003D0FE651